MATSAGVHIEVDHERKVIRITPSEDGTWDVVLGAPLARIRHVLGSITGLWRTGRVDAIDQTQWRG